MEATRFYHDFMMVSMPDIEALDKDFRYYILPAQLLHLGKILFQGQIFYFPPPSLAFVTQHQALEKQARLESLETLLNP